MTLKVRILIAVGLVLLLVMIINMVRKRELELKYVLGWILCDVTLLVFTAFPWLMQKMAEFMGIYSPVNMIFFFGFIFSMVIIFTLTVALSRVTERVRRLSQMVALETQEQDRKMSEEIVESGNEKIEL